GRVTVAPGPLPEQGEDMCVGAPGEGGLETVTVLAAVARGRGHEADPGSVRRVGTRTLEQPIVDRGLAGLGHREPASAEGDDRWVHGGASRVCAAHCFSFRALSASDAPGDVRVRRLTISTSSELGEISSCTAPGP